MSKQYVCVRDCYYGPPGCRKLFKVGEVLPSGWKPNKHFIEGATVPPEETNGPPRTPGDDPRPTRTIINDLLSIHDIDMRGKTRKEVFAAWLVAESEKEVNPTGKEVLVDPDKTGPKNEDPFGTRKFSSFTPDMIESAKRDDIVDSINRRFKLDLTHGGKSKAQLVQIGIDRELRQVGARAV